MVSEKIEERCNVSEIVLQKWRKFVRHFEGRDASVWAPEWMGKESLPVVERYSDAFLLVG